MEKYFILNGGIIVEKNINLERAGELTLAKASLQNLVSYTSHQQTFVPRFRYPRFIYLFINKRFVYLFIYKRFIYLFI